MVFVKEVGIYCFYVDGCIESKLNIVLLFEMIDDFIVGFKIME